MVISYGIGTTETSALNRHSTLRKIPKGHVLFITHLARANALRLCVRRRPTELPYVLQSAISSTKLSFSLQVFSPTLYTFSNNWHVLPFPPYLGVFFPAILCVQYQTRFFDMYVS